jgi:PAS domain S-box-containing protein
MLNTDLPEVVNGTADAAYAVTNDGIIQFWNKSAEEYFGIGGASAIGSSCHELICGRSSCDVPFCQPYCAVLQRAEHGGSTPSFDVEVKTARCYRWANVSIIVVPVRQGRMIIHLVRDAHQRKQIETIVRRFLAQISEISGFEIEQLLSSAAVPHLDLTAQETTVLKMLVEGRSTKFMSEAMYVSPATVRNHVEHILRKLSAHSRLEAVLRAIREKLV